MGGDISVVSRTGRLWVREDGRQRLLRMLEAVLLVILVCLALRYFVVLAALLV